MPPSVLVPASASIVPVALLFSVLPLWIIPLVNCRAEAPVRVTVPPLIVELIRSRLLTLAEIVPPVLVTVVLVSVRADPAVASMVPVFVAPPLA